MTDQERVVVETRIGAPADDVWRAMRDPDRIRQWFGWDDHGLDDEIAHIFSELAAADDDARTLVWEDGDRIEVAEQDDGAFVRVVRTGARPRDWDGVYDAVDEGWITFVQQLRFLLERHPGQYRRTVAAHHLDLGTEDDALLDRLGLRPLGDDPVGSRWEVDHVDGRVGGEIWFQTDLQLGLTVEQEDDALLVVARTPASADPPHGTARFILSLYDTDDERAVATAERWHRWWGAD